MTFQETCNTEIVVSCDKLLDQRYCACTIVSRGSLQMQDDANSTNVLTRQRSRLKILKTWLSYLNRIHHYW